MTSQLFSSLPVFIAVAELGSLSAGAKKLRHTLTPVMTAYSLPEHAVYAVYPDREYLPHKIRLFIDFIQNKLGVEKP
ncbi:hypothetical protein P4S72_26010 [Vibrio sp. PP-XX7]